MADTNIEWADRVWNPVTGCTKVSQGCKNCYAEGVANRFWAKQYPLVDPSLRNENGAPRPRRFTDVMTHEDRLLEPLRWRKPARIFVNSMSDLFHEDVPDEFIMRVFEVMEQAKQHTFLVLTKRPARMLDVLGGTSGAGLEAPPLPNVHLGVSVENQQTADERIPLLLQTPAAVRFLSCEPLLGGLDLAKHRPGANRLWVIVGGESGHGARACDVGWVRSIVRQCQQADVPVFVKQLGASLTGEWHPAEGKILTPRRLRDKKGGDPSEWPEDLRVRELPEARA